MRKRLVSVIGGSACSPHEAQLAEEVGRLLAKNGFVLVCGGGGGIMEAACRGAQDEGGITIGLLSGENVTGGNSFLTIAIPTGLSHARNALVAQAGEIVIAIGGNTGTLSEISLAKCYGRKVIGLETWDANRSDDSPLEITEAEHPAQAVQLALELLQPNEDQLQ